MTLKYSHILVALDGSRQAEWAYKKAMDIALRNNAVLNLVNIIDNRSFGMVEAYDKNSAKRAKIEARDLLAKHKQEAEAAGVETVNVIVEYGVTKSVIPKEIAERTGADLIICGATGLTGAERIIMGSISQSIVRFAKCDVLVVRTEEDAARQEQVSE
ncbi:universal stress protein [Planomicrobium sp. MB-3u-38]|uniref:universal stress protein n=1 Tax=Planomicrobium sp. MB-3u-38 TaxID=2058318 RepID=UPI000C7A0E34|nr:universal stress protein [Planomicrobium sp. MB-3u-38]PKH12066.1 universal stress protein UspA [Planomicrobium sp. MB-3u-38]